MTRGPRGFRRWLGLALVCGTVASGCTSTGGVPSPAARIEPGRVDSRTHTRPRTTDIGEVTVAVPTALSDYHAVAREDVLSLVLPGPYVTERVNGADHLAVDGDVMAGVRVVGADPHTVEYRFRPEAVWSDGAPIGCVDLRLRHVAATTLLPEADARRMFGPRVDGYHRVSRITCAPDGRSGLVTFHEPYADFRALFDRLLPAHPLLRAVGATDPGALTPEQTLAAADFLRDAGRDTGGGMDPAVALSGGPYLVSEATAEHTTLIRNPRWWGRPGGPSRIVVLARDTPTSVTLLREGRVVAAQLDPDPATAAALRADEGLRAVAAPSGAFEHLDVNLDAPAFVAGPELRQAVLGCVNRQSLVDKMVLDRAPGTTPLGGVLLAPGEPGYVDHYAELTVQAGRARKILEDRGWALGTDGVYARAGGRASVRVGYEPTPGRDRIAEEIRRDCALAGVEIVPTPAPGFTGAPGHDDWDTALLTGSVAAVKASILGPAGVRGGTAGVIADPEVLDVYRPANAELDPTRRLARLNAADRELAARGRVLPLYTVPAFVVGDPAYPAIGYLADGGLFWNAYAWQRG